MSWSLSFDEPITLAKGKVLRTLRDAAAHVMALPKKEADLPHWRLAVQCLLSAADKSGPVMTAQIAMLQALHAGTPERLAEPRRRGQQRNTGSVDKTRCGPRQRGIGSR